ncbi:hypothetical protein EIP91_000070 [Steccherinum ochraceum]|uniref:Thiaminase-2/PQQC domain-containing protein n=1 Tax=Steccherinum ochraceum TaxID=92696 RepID=A0A4R0S2R7_9APHY|nr:hypothetical protein EIP91_000070 [Steccherinum ochraceum]
MSGAPPPPPSLTSHLTSLPTARPYSAATHHPFLTAAGSGTLAPASLALFLSQDRLYAAHGYVTFLGHLLTKIPFASSRSFASPEEELFQRVVRIVEYSLQNVLREVGFFGDTAARFGLDLEGWTERKGTRDYLAELARVGALGTMEDCMVFLWAMERVRSPSPSSSLCAIWLTQSVLWDQVYIDAWKYVGSLVGPEQPSADPSAVQQAVAFLVSNWTNDEFAGFVSDLEHIVNALDIKPNTKAWTRAEEIWARVVELEEQFWPDVEREAEELASLRATLP